MKAIEGISTNGESVILDASDPKLASLKAGDVLVIKSFIARKILVFDIQGQTSLPSPTYG